MRLLGAEFFGMLSSPNLCAFAVNTVDALTGPEGSRVITDDIYEALLFNAHVEMRWLRDGAIGGRAGVVSETARALDSRWIAINPVASFALDDRLLLWGEPISYAVNWTRFETSRIGHIHVPFVQIGQDQRIAAVRRTYFAEGEDGNPAIVASRLVGFQGLQKPKVKGTRV